MFEHLDDPFPPPDPTVARAGVERRVGRLRRRRTAARAAVGVVAVLGVLAGLGVASDLGAPDQDIDVVDAPEGASTRCCGTVSGTVTADAVGLPGVRVALLYPNGTVKAAVDTDDEGTYRFADLEAGSYRVQFIDPTYQRRTEWWPDATRPSDGRTISLGRFGREVVDAELEAAPGQGIHGQVFVAGGWPIAGVTVWVFDRGDLVRGVQTDERGEFAMDGFAPGEYQVLFWDDEDDRFPPEWYRDASRRDSASPVVVVGGEDAVVRAQVDLWPEEP